MPYNIEEHCPCYKKIANGLDEIEILFGWRRPNGKIIPQSYCKDCRSANVKQENLVR